MHNITEPFPGILRIEAKPFSDQRGLLKKLYTSEWTSILPFDIGDIYTTTSDLNVLRGLHYQKTPYGQAKLVSCLHGLMIDIALDIRQNSPTFGKVHLEELNPHDGCSVLVPPGFAHGTFALCDDTISVSVCAGPYLPRHERGFHPLSLKALLGLSNAPILSLKDPQLPAFTHEQL